MYNPSQPHALLHSCITHPKHGRVASFTKSLNYKQISTHRNATNRTGDWTIFISHLLFPVMVLRRNFFLTCFSISFSLADVFRHSPLFNPDSKKMYWIFRGMDIVLTTHYFPCKLYCLLKGSTTAHSCIYSFNSIYCDLQCGSHWFSLRAPWLQNLVVRVCERYLSEGSWKEYAKVSWDVVTNYSFVIPLPQPRHVLSRCSVMENVAGGNLVHVHANCGRAEWRLRTSGCF